MLNRTPPNNTNTTNTLNAYRKRRQMFKGPFLIYGLAAILLIAGIALVIGATRSGNNPLSAVFATKTPTATLTSTLTNTPVPSPTSTETITPTITITSTPTGDLAYTVKEGDTLQSIAEQYNLGSDGPQLIYQANKSIQDSGGVIFAGQPIVIPHAGTLLATTTPLPPLGRGAKIPYTVLPGDTLAGIAAKFNSTTDDIISLNKLDNPNSLQAGVILQIPVNLVTSTATLPPSSTPVTPTIEGQPTLAPTVAGAATSAPLASCAPTENATFVTDLQKLINDARTAKGLATLNFNDKLTAAAKAHATDMVCNNYLSHLGLNGSTPESRVSAAGYKASVVAENLFALQPAYGGNPQAAMTWWTSDATSNANILNANLTEVGIAYVSYDKSLFGSYFVVVFAKP